MIVISISTISFCIVNVKHANGADEKKREEIDLYVDEIALVVFNIKYIRSMNAEHAIVFNLFGFFFR